MEVQDFRICRWTDGFKLISIYDGLKHQFKFDKSAAHFEFNTKLVSLLSPNGVVNRTTQRVLLKKTFGSLEWVQFYQKTIRNKTSEPCVSFEDFKKIVSILEIHTPETKSTKRKRDVPTISKTDDISTVPPTTTPVVSIPKTTTVVSVEPSVAQKDNEIQKLELQIKLQKIQLKIKREETKIKQEETKIIMYRQQSEISPEPTIRKNPLTNGKLAEIWSNYFNTDFLGLCQICKIKKVNPIGLKIHKLKEAQNNQQLFDPSNLILACNNCSRNSNLQLINKQNKHQRVLVWLNTNGTKYISTCFCCRKAEIRYYGNWHIGHVVPHSLGGTTDLINLKTICIDCNLDMKSENMNDYIIRNNYDKIPHVGDSPVDRKQIQELYEELKKCAVEK